MPWGQVKDDFDLAVDEVMTVADKFGLSREDITRMMKGLEAVKDDPGFDVKEAGARIKAQLIKMGL